MIGFFVLGLATASGPGAQGCTRLATVTHAASPAYPASERNAGHGVETALVKVTLDATGKVVAASVAQSTDNLALDRAAVDAANASTYSPGEVNCRPQGGTFLFRVVFAPPGSAPASGKLDACDHAAAATQIVAPNTAGYTFSKPFPLHATITVNVDAKGQPQTASILTSSGDAAFDSLMYVVAAHASYIPAMVHCIAQPGTATLGFGLVRK
ncbi:MAG TPA: energy transducer TonB [Candidatus Baltobacteraceae bacterium]|jgi:TonB family protein